MRLELHLGDCLEVLRELPSSSVDAVVCDPPAGISFMGSKWDSDKGGRDKWIQWLSEVMTEALRVAKPGAHALVWALPRTSHWTGTALELSGWEVRDCLQHHFGSGFPKSLDISKAIDRAAGHLSPEGANFRDVTEGRMALRPTIDPRTYQRPAPATPEAQQWSGWGTALKPASEFWWLCRAPLIGTVASNVLEHGTGGINVEGCRVGTDDPLGRAKGGWLKGGYVGGESPQIDTRGIAIEGGRWPPHLLLSHGSDCEEDRCGVGCPVAEMDSQSGDSVSRSGVRGGDHGWGIGPGGLSPHNDQGGASRFFPTFRYSAKPSRREREKGCQALPVRSGGEAVGREEGSAGMENPRAGAGRTAAQIHNHHPTLKGQDLMGWLVRLITPPGGVVLDPFMGSGSTGIAASAQGFGFVGVEREPDFYRIARARIAHAAPGQALTEPGDQDRPATPTPRQASLWGSKEAG